ncbi:MAG: DEAD/DEAH box helicase family protein, partial [Sphaerochaetaceae bacterium]
MAQYNTRKEIENLEELLQNNNLKFLEKEEYDNDIYSMVYQNEKIILILDYNLTKPKPIIFDYSLYTNIQNKFMRLKKEVYRFTSDASIEEMSLFVNGTIDDIQSYSNNFNSRPPDNSSLENYFEKLISDVYGNLVLGALYKDYPLISLNKTNLFIDYVIEKKNGEKIGLEENGVSFHHPQITGKTRYSHQLEKQNLCSKLGIKLFRLSTMDCKFTEKVKEEILSFFGDKKDFIYRPLIGKREFKLYEHQEKAIQELKELHKKEGSCALFVFPTATGKTQIVLQDLDDYYLDKKDFKVLIISPTRKIASQWTEELKNKHFFHECGTYNLLWKKRNILEKDYYDYIVVDEAHHAVAQMTKTALSYFTPKLLVGLTATPDRLDKKRLEQVFGEYSTNLSLKEAMEKEIVSKVRSYRIETNLNLSEVRCNGKEFVNSDLEKSLRVSSRNELIAQILKKYFSHSRQKGIIFCVSTEHTKRMVKILNSYGFSAQAVSSKEKNPEKILKEFHEGKFRFLCACDMVNEGWNEPDLEIIVMARPTLSKVLYQQQIGRGLRKTPNKKELFVIDVVDQYGSLTRPISCHSLLNRNMYFPFADVLKDYNKGDIIEVNGLFETITSIIPIDITTFESLFSGLYDTEQAARELFISTSTLNNWINKKQIEPDRVLPFGRRNIYYFSLNKLEDIKKLKGLQNHNENTIKQDFFDFINEKNYTFSFKIVFLLGLLQFKNKFGEVEIEKLLDFYRDFYLKRIEAGLPVDRKGCIYTYAYLQDKDKIKENLLQNPF